MSKDCLLTNDVETTSVWFNSLREETGLKVLREGLPILLDIYDKYQIKSTFFFTWYMAKLFPRSVKLVTERGHEIGSHGKSHLRENGFDRMPFERQKRHLDESKKMLEDLSGQVVISFRAPALRVNNNTARALIETGFKIDSSIASQRFDFFLSFGSIYKLKWLIAPRLPYRTSPESLFKKGDGPLTEIPLSAMFFPYVGTTMRIFPWLTSIQRHAISLETNLNDKPVVFDIHPNEFIDESSEPRVIQNRSGNIIGYLIQDWLRARLKTKNLGNEAIPLYTNEIDYYVRNKYSFMTIRDYCEKRGFPV